MQREILIQALQSEGVPTSVIREALTKAEMWNMERLIRNRIDKALAQAEGAPNVFEEVRPTMKRIVKCAPMA